MSVKVYKNYEECDFNDDIWYVELNTKIIGKGITRYVFETIKDETSLRILQNKLLLLEELMVWMKNSNYNSSTTIEEAEKRYTMVIKYVREKLNEFCNFFGEDLYINED